jgi:hypothetical protein
MKQQIIAFIFVALWAGVTASEESGESLLKLKV